MPHMRVRFASILAVAVLLLSAQISGAAQSAATFSLDRMSLSCAGEVLVEYTLIEDEATMEVGLTNTSDGWYSAHNEQLTAGGGSFSFTPEAHPFDKAVISVTLASGPLYVYYASFGSCDTDATLTGGLNTGPTVEVTPTVPDKAGPNITISLDLPQGMNLGGAPWVLYAQTASQLPVGAYDMGVVNADNTITMSQVPAGEYRLVISPEGGEVLEFALNLDGVSTAITLQVPGETSATPVAPGGKDTSSGSSTGKVTSLPSTGSGEQNASIMIAAFALACVAMGAVGLIGRASLRRQ